VPLSKQLFFAFAFVTAGSGYANAYVPAQPAVPTLPLRSMTSDTWFGQIWNSFFLFLPATAGPLDAAVLPIEPAPAPSPCVIEPLPPIEDAEAVAFEAGVGSSAVVDTDGLTPATARALVRFTRVITAAGGSITVTSAYRPSAYQEHLQAVWDKWMTELRDNEDAGCQELKAEVQEEFTRHQLLQTQRPVPVSDHTRGLAFDAAVQLPKLRRRVTQDSLARLAGLRRPAIERDPVHFRFAGARM
jgi:hypothetical protein